MALHLEAFVAVLVALQLGSSQQCDLVITTESQLKEDINQTLHAIMEEEGKYCKKYIDRALKQAVEDITHSVQQLMAPVLMELNKHRRL